METNQQLCCWFHHHLFINMTNVFLICAGMLGSDVAKNNGELSILGRPNPSCKLERIVEAHGGYLPFYRRVINGFRYLKTMLLAPGRIPNMIARVDEAAQMLHAASETSAVAEAWNCIDSFHGIIPQAVGRRYCNVVNECSMGNCSNEASGHTDGASMVTQTCIKSCNATAEMTKGMWRRALTSSWQLKEFETLSMIWASAIVLPPCQQKQQRSGYTATPR